MGRKDGVLVLVTAVRAIQAVAYSGTQETQEILPSPHYLCCLEIPKKGKTVETKEGGGDLTC